MKPPSHKMRRLRVRIKPGGFLRIPLTLMQRSGWQPGDTLICEKEGDGIRLFKPPTETAWRIERLRRRISQHSADNSTGFSADTYGEYRRMTRSSTRQKNRNTPVGPYDGTTAADARQVSCI